MDLIELLKIEKEEVFAKRGQLLRRDEIAHVRGAEVLRYLKLHKGMTRFIDNRKFASEMIRRNVLRLERHVEFKKKSGMRDIAVLNSAGIAIIHQAVVILRDYGMAEMVQKGSGVYRITHYGNWVCEQWFSLHSQH